MLAVATCALLLTGCAQPDPVVTSRATSTVKPLFASDADALAAATKAYAAYLKMSDLIAQEGGANPERLAPLVTPKWLKSQTTSFHEMAKSGNRQMGETTFEVDRLQQLDDQGTKGTQVVIYVCADLSKTKLLDSSGKDVTPPGVQTVVPFEETLQTENGHGAALLISEETVWTGKNFC